MCKKEYEEFAAEIERIQQELIKRKDLIGLITGSYKGPGHKEYNDDVLLGILCAVAKDIGFFLKEGILGRNPRTYTLVMGGLQKKLGTDLCICPHLVGYIEERERKRLLGEEVKGTERDFDFAISSCEQRGILCPEEEKKGNCRMKQIRETGHSYD